VKLLLDEMHAPAVATELRARGYDAVAVKERPELVGVSDHELLVAATAEGRTVVTENVKDFVALSQRGAAAGDQHAGLVFTHPRRFNRAARNYAQTLSQALGLFVDEHASTLEEVDSFVWWLERANR
jgi:predicted nuclease of predicted toxin-antitoxin system